jgi:SAM-dependent methyltransferase
MDAADWDRRYASDRLVWSAGPNASVAAEAADLPPGRALDLGAGEGRNARWLAGRGWQVTAVDFSAVALDKGRSLAGPGDRVEWVHADVLSHDAGDGTRDLALLAYLQLEPDQRRTAVRRAFSALRVGGTFLLVAHDATNLAEGTGGPQDPAVLCTAEEVLADLDGERFEVERAERVSRTVPGSPDGPGHQEPAHRAEAGRTAYDCVVRLLRTA